MFTFEGLFRDERKMYQQEEDRFLFLTEHEFFQEMTYQTMFDKLSIEYTFVNQNANSSIVVWIPLNHDEIGWSFSESGRNPKSHRKDSQNQLPRWCQDLLSKVQSEYQQVVAA